MEVKQLGYHIDQVKQVGKEIDSLFNFRSPFISTHLYMLVIYHFTIDSYFFQSFYNQTHLYYYGFLLLYTITLYYFSKSCDSPGFAIDETDVERVDNEANIDPNRFYCKHCKIYVPIRASHCSKCQKCILRRDHHCPYTDCCIGRDNHAAFFIYSTLELCSQSIACFDVTSHFIIYLFFNSNLHYTMLTIFIYVQVICASTFGTVKTFVMFRDCLTGIIKNKTTWERTRRSHITYLKDLPYGYSPFDKGIIENFVEIFTMKQKKMKWTVKPPDASQFSNELLQISQNDGNIFE